MKDLYQRLNDIVNPGFRYFSEDSAEFQQGKREFESAIKQGDASVFINLLEDEYSRICASGSTDYKYQIHLLVTEIKTAAWKNCTRQLELTNEEIQFLKILLSNNRNGAEPLVDSLKGKLNERCG